MALSKKDRAADQRLRRVYGKSLAWYNKQFKTQGGCCAVCRRKPKKLRLAVDHNHAVERTKITLYPPNLPSIDHGWLAYAFIENPGGHGGIEITGLGETKAEAIAECKLKLKSRSVRGLLCMICNRKVLGAMERFKVRPDAVRAYLEQYDHNNPLIQPQE